MQTKRISPICSKCCQSGHGPLEQAPDGSGYRHSYGCPEVNHHGQPCIRNNNLFCQEGYCSECGIPLEVVKKTKKKQARIRK